MFEKESKTSSTASHHGLDERNVDFLDGKASPNLAVDDGVKISMVPDEGSVISKTLDLNSKLVRMTGS
jgi:hypothetical protein